MATRTSTYNDIFSFWNEADNDLHAFREACSDPIVVVASDGTISHCNQALLRQTGYVDVELHGKPIDLLMQSYNVQDCELLENNNSAPFEGRYILMTSGVIMHKNRSSLEAKLSFIPLNLGRNAMLVIVCRFASSEDTIATINCSTDYTGIVGNSKPIVAIRDMIALVGKTDSCVLITGESGTGKELVANAIHAASRRAQRPLVKLNCAAMPETLLESELFGHMKGSFTGAEKNSCGLLKAADGGTLFLDEIGDLSIAGQSKLLRVLETQEFNRIGDPATIKIDVRIIAATNQSLSERIQDRLFREDLYYRLSVMEIHMPPLRERTEDISVLVEHFLNSLNSKFKKSIHAVSDEVLNVFLAYSWPGNIRELSHMLERACIVCQDTVIDQHHLPTKLQKSNGRSAVSSERQGVDSAAELQEVLSRTGGNKASAARMLGINRKTLYRHLKKYHVDTSL